MDDGTDAVLVARWLSGDTTAADTLVERHFDGLLAYADRRRYGGLEPEEAVQGVFLKLIEKGGLWRPEDGSLRSWLVTILENEFRSAHRARKARRRLVQALVDRRGETNVLAESPSICERHHVLWFNPEVLGSIMETLGRLRPERAALLLGPAKGFACAERAALSRARRHISRALGIGLRGPALSLEVARELMVATECGKIPKETFR